MIFLQYSFKILQTLITKRKEKGKPCPTLELPTAEGREAITS